ncbi:MAG: hypothetical protein NVSMB6_17240 [Burkholderiaceae bacterium]
MLNHIQRREQFFLNAGGLILSTNELPRGAAHSPARTRLRLALVVLVAAAAACTTISVPVEPVETTLYEGAVSSPLRTDADRALDAARKPIEFLKFAKVVPGMQVLDVAAGGGATTRLLAVAVGTSGKVYSQGQAPRPAFEKRLSEYPQANVVPVTRPYDDPLPAGTPMLDLIVINLSYHDIANLPLDRIGMDRRLFNALKPGGHLVVIDHAARTGSGTSDTRTLHRIDERLVQADMEQAGFKLEQSADYLRNTADTRVKKSSEMERVSDRFALRFVKAAEGTR